MNLRPYQQEALDAIQRGFAAPALQADGTTRPFLRQLVVLPTGAGKTILFAHVAKSWLSERRGRVLVLAHREELVAQAQDKLHRAAGVWAQREKAACRASREADCVVASVQTMTARLERWPEDHFALIIVDEAHHALADSWQGVMARFPNARVLGVTATPSRSDRRALGAFFENVAYETGLLQLVREGFLCPIRATKLDVGMELAALRGRRDYSLEDGAAALRPQLAAVAGALARECWDKKLLVFLPLVDVSEAFAKALRDAGLQCGHVSGDADAATRKEVLRWFSEPGPRALCNAMLLTEGFDQPDVDAICCLRPTKSAELYAQIVGRGTRVSPGKETLTIYDPLWLTGSHNLCRPADIFAASPQHRDALQARLEQGMTSLAAEQHAQRDVAAALEAQLKKAAKKKIPRGFVDPLRMAVEIGDAELATWEPTLPWHSLPATPDTLRQLALRKIHADEMMTEGLGLALLERCEQRKRLGLASPAQVKFCRQLGIADAELLTAGQAGAVIHSRGRAPWNRRAA